MTLIGERYVTEIYVIEGDDFVSKLIIVSNRLPVTVLKEEEAFEYHKSLGGLATGLKSYHEIADSLWIGWPGITSNELKEQDKQEIRKKLKTDHGCLPAFLSEEEKEDYYEGFWDQILWVFTLMIMCAIF